MNDPRSQLAVSLVERAGGFLRNVVRTPNVTCEVCAAPVASAYKVCFQCAQHFKSGAPLADRVGSVIYAIEKTQAYSMMLRYKAQRPSEQAAQNVASLLTMAMLFHTACCGRLAQAPIDGWACVPSTRRARGEHPLRQIARLLVGTAIEVPVMAARLGPHVREIDTSLFGTTGAGTSRRHVLVIDDSWVTGASAQSVAAMLRQHGAKQVSILTIARVLSPTFGPNPEFIRSRLQGPFNPDLCPWTGADCP